ncbi:MAG: Flagellar biosynthesis protein FlhB, partial [uncultured Nocardioides sp.]
ERGEDREAHRAQAQGVAQGGPGPPHPGARRLVVDAAGGHGAAAADDPRDRRAARPDGHRPVGHGRGRRRDGDGGPLLRPVARLPHAGPAGRRRDGGGGGGHPGPGRVLPGHQVDEAEAVQAQPDRRRQAGLRAPRALGGREDAHQERPGRRARLQRHPVADAADRRHGADVGGHRPVLLHRARPDPQHRGRRAGDGGGRLRHVAAQDGQADADDQGGGQAGAQEHRGRPPREERHPLPPARRGTQPHDGRRADRRRRAGQPHPRRDRAALRGREGCAARGGPRCRRGGGEDPREGHRGGRAAGARRAARPRALHLHQGGPGGARRALPRRRAGARVRDQPPPGRPQRWRAQLPPHGGPAARRTPGATATPDSLRWTRPRSI